MNYKKGFTLIELLVVIAIIALLSSVVLASMRSASDKANDSKVRASLDGIRKQASIHFNENGNYTTLCSIEPGLSMILAARSAGGGNAVDSTCNTGYSGGEYKYAAFAKLKTGGYWCVDYSGNSKYEASAVGSATICP